MFMESQINLRIRAFLLQLVFFKFSNKFLHLRDIQYLQQRI